MIRKVAKTGVFVGDQQRALDFYTNVLEFELIADQPMGPGARWIEVKPPGGETALALWTPPGLEDRIGSFTGIVLSCDDIQATYEKMRGLGVEFEMEPTDQPGGVMAAFKDPDGNSFVLREGD
jgi:predicted enzyme related to lactoylglutathione lyase